MSIFELLPPPGAADTLGPKKSLPQRLSSQKPPARHKVRVKHGAATVRASLRRFQCPCGCERRGWFSQPRSLRSSVVVGTPES